MSTSLHLRHIRLRVTDLARSVAFYTGRLGFIAVRRDAARVDLATTPQAAAILTLEGGAEMDTDTTARNAAGLFHAALRFPDRGTLGAWLRHAAERGVEFDGFSDHGVSEAIYFRDPDGNGLEFYVDRPREQWPFADGELAMTTNPLDVPSLLTAGAALAAGNRIDPLAGADWGHVHLRVTDLDRSEKFYREALPIAVTQRSYPGARFLAAEGYHHHLGLNVWGAPKRPQPALAAGLAEVTFARRGIEQTQQAVDPDGIALRVVPLGRELAAASVAIRGSP